MLVLLGAVFLYGCRVQKEEPAPQQNSKNLLEKVKNFYFTQKAKKKSGDSTQNLDEEYPQLNNGVIQTLPNRETVISYPVYTKRSFTYSTRIGYVKRYVVKLNAQDSITEVKTFEMIGNMDYLRNNKDNIPVQYYQGTMPTNNFILLLEGENNNLHNYNNVIFKESCKGDIHGYFLDRISCRIIMRYFDFCEQRVKDLTLPILVSNTLCAGPGEGIGGGGGGSGIGGGGSYIPVDESIKIESCQNSSSPIFSDYNNVLCANVPLNGCNGSLNDNTCPTGDCCREEINNDPNIEVDASFSRHQKLLCIYDKLKDVTFVKKIVSPFKKEGNKQVKLILKCEPIAAYNGNQTAGTTDASKLYTDGQITITINENILDKIDSGFIGLLDTPNLQLAQVMIHEMFHAYLHMILFSINGWQNLETTYSFPNTSYNVYLSDLKKYYKKYPPNPDHNKPQHNVLALDKNLEDMAKALREWDIAAGNPNVNELELQNYTGLYWLGLKDTDRWEEKTKAPESRIKAEALTVPGIKIYLKVSKNCPY